MTNDRHIRIRNDGSVSFLPSLNDSRVGSDNPEEDALLEAQFLQRNRHVAKLLQAKGFGLSGDEPLSNQIRRVQMTGEGNEE